MKAVLCVLTTCLAAIFAGHTHADEIDGLDPGVRQLVYGDRTAGIAVLDFRQLKHADVVRTVRGAFDPDSFARVAKQAAELEKSVQKATKVIEGLLKLDFPRATIVALEDQGLKPLAILPLGFDVNEFLFTTVQISLSKLLSYGGSGVEIDRKNNFVIAHQPGAGVGTMEHDAAVEQKIMTGLAQQRGTPAIAFVALPSNALRGALGMAMGSLPELAGATAAAQYAAGYVVAGDRPELHLYLRFPDDAQAAGMKSLYDKAWSDRIAAAAAADKADETAKAEGKFVLILDAHISRETMYRRLSAASTTTLFGNIVMLDLDTFDLREITGALVDRYFRPGE